MKEQEEQHGADFFTVFIPESIEDEQSLKQLITDYLRNEGDPEKYEINHEDNGRFAAQSLSGGSSRYFSVRKGDAGEQQVHPDDDSEY